MCEMTHILIKNEENPEDINKVIKLNDTYETFGKIIFNPNSNFNTSYLLTSNNMNFKDSHSLMNYGYLDFNNTFYAGDKICFNENDNNSYMYYNKKL